MRVRTHWLLAGAVVVVLASSAAAAADLPIGGTFIDDNGNVHEGNIEAIASAGITKGCNPAEGNTRYCPRAPVSRGQMAAFLTRALDLPPTAVDYFIDDDDSVFEADINSLSEAGITKGCSTNSFCPQSNVTRGQMAAFLRRAFDYPAGVPGRFRDSTGSVFEADIEALAAVGVTKGCNPAEGNTMYCPESAVSRDQMASFLVRALDLDPIQPPRATAEFGEGTWLVGVDISPGTYRSSSSGDRCAGMWLYLSEGGVVVETGGPGLVDGGLVATLVAGETFFTAGCGAWTTDLSSPRSELTAPLGNGAWITATDLEPGMWRTNGTTRTDGGGCFWQRLSGFHGYKHEDVIAVGASYDSMTVRIAPSDVGFYTADCETWTYLGP